MPIVQVKSKFDIKKSLLLQYVCIFLVIFSEFFIASYPQSEAIMSVKKLLVDFACIYPDEYEMLMKTIQDNGYKKVEYFLACMTSAKKQSLASEYKQYTVNHAKRYKVDLSEAKRAQQEDYYSRRAELESKRTPFLFCPNIYFFIYKICAV